MYSQFGSQTVLRSLVTTLTLAAGVAMSAETVPAARLIDWSVAGVPGGIPNRTTVYTSLPTTASASTIQTALDNCPAGQVVVLAAGTYSLSSGLYFRRDNILLRGQTNAAGEPTTILNFASGAGGWGLLDFSKTTYPTSPGNVLDILSGATQGSTSFTLSAAPSGLAVGQVLAVDQVCDNDLVWNQGTQGGGTWGRNGDRTLTQFVRVTSVNGSTVTFAPALYSPYWSAARTPQVYWWGSGTSLTTKLSGVENLKIVRAVGGGGQHNISIGPADSCWVKNVWSTQCNAAHVRTGWTINCEVRDCYFTLHDNIGSATYSVWLSYSSMARVENNIMFNTPCAYGIMSTAGSIYAYNFSSNFPYATAGWMPECVMTHGGHNHQNLFEGNYVPTIWKDWIHGNSSYDLYARNRLTGYEPGKTGSTRPVNLEQNQDYITVVGNVLGTAGYHTSYEDSGNTSIWNINSDSAPTFLRKGNWNTVNQAIPTNEALGSDTVANSYVYSSKPAWFGDRPWPAYSPTSPASASPTSIPAGYRFYNGSFPSAGTTGGSAAPAPPVDVSILSVSQL